MTSFTATATARKAQGSIPAGTTRAQPGHNAPENTADQ